jgi:uncharacterized protein YlxW (UPF0749 family)
LLKEISEEQEECKLLQKEIEEYQRGYADFKRSIEMYL